MIAERFGLDGQDEGAILIELRGGLVRELVTDDAVILALRRARAAGWTPFVVTNGTVAQQERKLRHTGLDREVAGWVVSEGAGLRKPDPAIFRFAAAQAGQSLDGAWMIGDSAAGGYRRRPRRRAARRLAASRPPVAADGIRPRSRGRLLS